MKITDNCKNVREEQYECFTNSHFEESIKDTDTVFKERYNDETKIPPVQIIVKDRYAKIFDDVYSIDIVRLHEMNDKDNGCTCECTQNNVSTGYMLNIQPLTKGSSTKEINTSFSLRAADINITIDHIECNGMIRYIIDPIFTSGETMMNFANIVSSLSQETPDKKDKQVIVMDTDDNVYSITDIDPMNKTANFEISVKSRNRDKVYIPITKDSLYNTIMYCKNNNLILSDNTSVTVKDENNVIGTVESITYENTKSSFIIRVKMIK